ncbi:hypothetical protein BDV95DRAFT_588055 [Massariosphaeria phaeospora]|uniref:DUF7357 domain-containing protein n=1 Tax=Massariosphaeria phaeospora TaxID=100035 RepID=A0A7C8ME63_9PLEO|nr:hypothetical protein BDV95DRAFT_588055 [Massariosphaeria phaeospora]
MRLRVSVQRHRLPANNIVWSLPGDHRPQAYTIARLLEDINQILPLEAEHWGLEDYVVEVGGFECLHFAPVTQVLKDDDTVSIRPLLTAEVRSRTLCGRYQISDAGQHLVDGVPFGRPYLRQPKRPAVAIPPRKRSLLDDNVEGADDPDEPRLITANGHFSDEHADDAENSGYERQDAARPNKRQKTVHFTQPVQDESDSEDDDEDFAPPEDSDDNDVGMDTVISSGDSDTSSSGSDSDDSSSDSDSDSSSSSESDVDSGTIATVTTADKRTSVSSHPLINADHSSPGQGLKTTMRRNRRRSESKRLRKLQSTGVLGVNANLKDYRQYVTSNPPPSQPPTEDTSHVDMMTAYSGTKTHLERGSKFEVTSEGVTYSFTKDELFGVAKKQEWHPGLEKPSKAPETPSTKPTEAPPARRLKPDVTAIGRIIAHQTRPLVKKTPKPKAPQATAKSDKPEGASDPDFWKSRVNLSAFECWKEEVELSVPPFPFKQHWDPVSKSMMKNNNNKKKKKNKKGGRNDMPRDSIDENPEHIILDYDDAPAAEKPESDASEAIESQLMQDVETAAKSDNVPLPEDVESLPALAPADLKVGATIVCKVWAINHEKFTPEISEFQTAIVESEGDSGNGGGIIRLKLAQQGLPGWADPNVRKTADKFGIADDEDDGVWEGAFTELVEPKLLKAA